MNSITTNVIKSAIKQKSSELLELLEDLAKEECLTEEQAVAAIGLMRIAGWDDHTCSLIDLIAPDYPDKDTSEVQKANRKTVENFIRWFVKD